MEYGIFSGHRGNPITTTRTINIGRRPKKPDQRQKVTPGVDCEWHGEERGKRREEEGGDWNVADTGAWVTDSFAEGSLQ